MPDLLENMYYDFFTLPVADIKDGGESKKLQSHCSRQMKNVFWYQTQKKSQSVINQFLYFCAVNNGTNTF